MFVWSAARSKPLAHVAVGSTSRRLCRPTHPVGIRFPEFADSIPEGMSPCPRCALAQRVPRGVAVVYAVAVDDDIKIGWTEDLPTRTFQHGGDLIAYRKGSLELEGRVLDTLAPLAVRGREWFSRSDRSQVVRSLMAAA